MPSAGTLPRKAISEMVAYLLNQKGKTIKAIEFQKNTKYKGDESQKPYRNNPVWHNRQDLLDLVAEKLKIHSDFVGPDRKSADFYNAVDQEITKLRNKRLLVMWSSTRHCGIWRIADSFPAVSAPTMSADTFTHVSSPDDHDLKQLFLSILTKGRKDNTYKFTLAKSLLDYCIETPDATDKNHEIPYTYFASKFLKYYWYQEYKFRMKQDFRVNSKPKVITALNDVFGASPPTDFKLLDPDDVKKAEEKILCTVFGRAKSKTSLVIPKFQSIPDGKYVKSSNAFYDYDDDRKILSLKPKAFRFLRYNHGILSKAVLAEWAKFLEKINHTLPRLVAKIEQDGTKRGPLTEYRKLFSEYAPDCFYCGSRLERDYTHVDHFIPWSYIFDDNAWNFVLACQECNCKKSDSLPQIEFRDLLLERNSKYSGKIKKLELSLNQLNTGKGWRPEIVNHYNNCLDYGFQNVHLP